MVEEEGGGTESPDTTVSGDSEFITISGEDKKFDEAWKANHHRFFCIELKNDKETLKKKRKRKEMMISLPSCDDGDEK